MNAQRVTVRDDLEGLDGRDSLDGLYGLDQAIDAAFEPLRGRPGVDRAAAVVSNLADYGLIWVALALLKARRRGPGRRRAVVALAAAGFSSLFVNRAVKAAVSRERPEDHLLVAVRPPTSSSFPSGHTLAAFCTAIVLAESDAQTAAQVGFASAVAASRVHLRAHHPTDVLGGAVIGSVLGLALRPVVNAVTPGRRGRTGRHGRTGRPGRRISRGRAR
jgi:undecaprenyl-diphosphatase